MVIHFQALLGDSKVATLVFPNHLCLNKLILFLSKAKRIVTKTTFNNLEEVTFIIYITSFLLFNRTMYCKLKSRFQEKSSINNTRSKLDIPSVERSLNTNTLVSTWKIIGGRHFKLCVKKNANDNSACNDRFLIKTNKFI